MLYILLTILAVFVLFNVYASRTVLRSKVHNESQKRMQLVFIWLLPVVGALNAVHVEKDKASRQSKPSGRLVGMEYEQGWDHASHVDDCSPDADCGE